MSDFRIQDANKAICRSCGTGLTQVFVDLGASPLANSYLKPEQLGEMEPFYPLKTYVCSRCLLVQLEEFTSPENIFSDYAYFSSYSDSWLDHAREYVNMVTERFGLNQGSQVVEIASNDGYLLQYFVPKGIPVLGIEPAVNVAKVAIEKGIPVISKFFGNKTAADLVASGTRADLLLGNNVLAHVPDLNDFVAGMKTLLKPDGAITMEFAYLSSLMEQNQFDTIYHEHFSYFSLHSVRYIFEKHNFKLFDVEVLPTHGGSLRIYATHRSNDEQSVSPRIEELMEREKRAALNCLSTYSQFTEQVHETKRKLLEFLIRARRNGKRIVGYGAPAKGNTLLNYCGIRTDFLDYTVDRSPHKQNHYLPGVRIPVYAPDKIRETRPDYVLILPWNIKDEVIQQMSYIREWGGAFAVPIPEVVADL